MAVTRDDLATLSPLLSLSLSLSLRSIVATFFGTFRAPDRKRVESMEIAEGKSGLILGEGKRRLQAGKERRPSEGGSRLPRKKLALPSELDEVEKFDPPPFQSSPAQCPIHPMVTNVCGGVIGGTAGVEDLRTSHLSHSEIN